MSTSLNSDQQAAADGFFKWLMEENSPYLIISGFGGVGKSFLISHLVDNVIPQYHSICELMSEKPKYTGVALTATSNKAAEVLSSQTGKPVGTIHSMMGLVVKSNFTTGKTVINKSRNWKVHQNIIVFVDECSWVDSQLFKYIEEGFINHKIVFVGDHCQLAPVMEKISPIYNRNFPVFELKQQMRNADQPALMNLCLQLRETVETGVFKPIQTVPGVIEHVDDQAAIELFNRRYIHMSPRRRILAYSNNRVIEYNDYLRQLRNQPKELQVGESLIVNSTYLDAYLNVISAETEVVIDNIHSTKRGVHLDEDIYIETTILELRTRSRRFNAHIPNDPQYYKDLLKYFSKNKKWRAFFRLKDLIIDLRPRDACTVHKSQGSTFDEVFIDCTNISTCNFADQVARMLYVAVSRAKHRVYLYGRLPDKYGGIC